MRTYKLPNGLFFSRLSIGLCFLMIIAGCQPRNAVMPRRWMLGVRVQDLTDDLMTHLHFSSKVFGVVIQEVTPNLPAEAHGFQKGDAIERINGAPVTGVKDLAKKINGSYGVVVIDCMRKTPTEEKLYVVRLQLDPAPGRLQEYSVKVRMTSYASRLLREFITDLFRPSYGAMPI
jgi:hypothetical protein